MFRRLIAAAALVVVSIAPALAGPVGCWVGASAGRGISTTRVASDAITVSADGGLLGLEAGCDYDFSSLITIGAMARYDWLDVSSSILGQGIGSDQMWTVAIRGGVKINPDLLAYGMLGYSGTDITLPGINWDAEGITYGAGLEFKIAETNLTGFVEWSRTELKKSHSLLGDIEPHHDAVRAGLRYKFNMPDFK